MGGDFNIEKMLQIKDSHSQTYEIFLGKSDKCYYLTDYADYDSDSDSEYKIEEDKKQFREYMLSRYTNKIIYEGGLWRGGCKDKYIHKINEFLNDTHQQFEDIVSITKIHKISIFD